MVQPPPIPVVLGLKLVGTRRENARTVESGLMRSQPVHVSHARNVSDEIYTNNFTSSVKCPELSIENGKVTVTDTSAVYECNVEYELTGADTMECQDSGEWSGVAPTCISTGK